MQARQQHQDSSCGSGCVVKGLCQIYLRLSIVALGVLEGELFVEQCAQRLRFLLSSYHFGHIFFLQSPIYIRHLSTMTLWQRLKAPAFIVYSHFGDSFTAAQHQNPLGLLYFDCLVDLHSTLLAFVLLL